MFSIEEAYEKIHNSKTKEYFKEILTTFNTGCYRSTIVMLYSITICDLIFKLQELIELYENPTATEILNNIDTCQKANPKSPDWENKLLDEIKSKTQLLDEAEYKKVLYLQTIRHLCSHPTIKKDENILYIPNRDEVKALIRNILDGVILKQPIMLNNILDQLINDISTHKDSLDELEFEKYLKSKYFNKMLPKIQLKIFRTLWKFVFRTSNDDCDNNRKANYKALCTIYKLQKDQIIDMINTDRHYFSIIEPPTPATYLLTFLCDYDTSKKIYNTLEESAQAIIKSLANNNLYLEVRAWFLNDNLQTHINQLSIKEITWHSIKTAPLSFINSINKLYTLSKELMCQNDFFFMIINFFNQSSYYDMADFLFTKVIKPYLNEFNKEHFEKLLEGINTNSQIYDRKLSYESNTIIKNYSDKFFDEEYYNNLSNFKYSRNIVQPEIDLTENFVI